MSKQLTLGSLFSGSGGFELAGTLAGIKPVWNCEIEPFPVMVTSKRFPDVKHYGDICDLNGGEIEPVDIITFGSPCQNLSLAGNRSGLDGTKSSLFFEAIRVIKEMRCATNGKYPRYIVWENVYGAFSSNKGQDFKRVLEEICKIKDEQVYLPQPDKWENAGEIVGDGYSVAWRLFDAQFWGVPQRRKRIYLVGDFTGGSAGKILFESEGLSGYSAESFRSWQRTACNTSQSTRKTGECYSIDGYNSAIDTVQPTIGVNCGISTGRNGVMILNDQGGNRMDITEDKTCTLRAESHHPPLVFENHSQDTRYVGPLDVAQTVLSTYGTGGNNQPFVVETPKTMKIRCGRDGGGKGALIQDNKSATLSCNNDQTVFIPKVYGICSDGSNAMRSDNPNSGIYEADTSRTVDTGNQSPSKNQGGMAVVCVDQGGGKTSCDVSSEISPTLACTHGGEPVVCIQGSVIGRAEKNGPQGSGVNENVSFTLNTADKHAIAYSMTTGSYMQISTEKTATLAARDYKDPPLVTDNNKCFSEKNFSDCKDENVSATLKASEGNYGGGSESLYVDTEYIVRRLTPTECARLQAFPDWWCSGLGIDEPTETDIEKWREIFEKHRKAITGASKAKTDKQIIKWLKNPHSDSAEYKMWGNGIALPNALFVLSGIVWADKL